MRAGKALHWVPVPRGNQPSEPLTLPVADLAQEILGGARVFCPLQVDRNPVKPCPIGRDGACAWNVRSPRDNYCFFRLLERCPEGVPGWEIVELLGVSKERVRQICREASHAIGDEDDFDLDG